jgi:hypothetical protein
MHSRLNRHFTVLAILWSVAFVASAQKLDKTVLIGKWEYTSYTMLQNGKPSGSVNFVRGTMLFTYREDGTWEMEAQGSSHTKQNGNYEVRGTELVMKLANGSPYQDLTLKMKTSGREMVLKDQRSIITASKLGTAE